MEITIKNVKHAAFASQETHCFNATVYIDGKKSFLASNDGRGGPDHYYPIKSKALCSKAQKEVYAEVNRIDAILGMEVIDLDTSGNSSYQIMNCLEIELCNLVNDFLREKAIKKDLKRVTYFDGTNISSLRAKPNHNSEKMLKETSWWKSSYVYINEMPMDEIKKLYRKLGY